MLPTSSWQMLTRQTLDSDGIQIHQLQSTDYRASRQIYCYDIKIRKAYQFKAGLFGHTQEMFDIQVEYHNLATFTLKRTFEEVERLYEVVRGRWPGMVVPGLPVRSLLGGGKVWNKIAQFPEAKMFDNREARKRVLERFLKIILNIAEVQQCPEIKSFLNRQHPFTVTFKPKKPNLLAAVIAPFSPKSNPYTPFHKSSLLLFARISNLSSLTSSYLQTFKDQLSLNIEASNEINIRFHENQTIKTIIKQIEEILERLYWMALDLRVYVEIIERRMNGSREEIVEIEKHFEMKKGAFMGEMEKELEVAEMSLVEIINTPDLDFKIQQQP